ncbi:MULTISPECIES: spore coat protein CotJB [Paenibacillus]|uniref:spore coat protein CotJB n=1 Tax=Paenibacillus TaxID=44249 RepID=UPI0022B90D6B|nr:spore coat protein CotJB [Paenibacillus caseinilyticus]MCZ8518662.1 spore coat protein CotJB [Paenibacillus caseinilyticus]
MTAKPKPLPQAYYTALEELQAIDFVLTELQLYLDTHPADEKALVQYKELSAQRLELVEPFERKYGPLLHNGRSLAEQPTEWNTTPWPWQV